MGALSVFELYTLGRVAVRRARSRWERDLYTSAASHRGRRVAPSTEGVRGRVVNRAEWHQAQAGGRPPEPALIRVTR